MKVEVSDYLLNEIDAVAVSEGISREQCVVDLIEIGLVKLRPSATSLVSAHLAEHQRLAQYELDEFFKAHP